MLFRREHPEFGWFQSIWLVLKAGCEIPSESSLMNVSPWCSCSRRNSINTRNENVASNRSLYNNRGSSVSSSKSNSPRSAAAETSTFDQISSRTRGRMRLNPVVAQATTTSDEKQYFGDDDDMQSSSNEHFCQYEDSDDIVKDVSGSDGHHHTNDSSKEDVDCVVTEAGNQMKKISTVGDLFSEP